MPEAGPDCGRDGSAATCSPLTNTDPHSFGRTVGRLPHAIACGLSGCGNRGPVWSRPDIDRSVFTAGSVSGVIDPVALAAAVRAHPGVARLDGGPFGSVTSLLAGRRRVEGVRVSPEQDAVELAVIARLGTPLPKLGAELGALVQRVCGPIAVEVTFSDVEVGDDTSAQRGTGRTDRGSGGPGGRRRPVALT